MARRVTWTNNSTDYDGTNVYRDTTIDPQNLPEPIATVDPVAQGATVEYIDLTGSGDQCYAVRDFDSSGDGALSDAYCFSVFDSVQVGDGIEGGIYAGEIEYGDGRRFHLIFAKQSGEVTGRQWGNYGTYIGIDGVDDGVVNQEDVLTNHDNGDSEAFYYCRDYTDGEGNNDYYLPAINELAKTDALVDMGHPDFSTDLNSFRWSSTEQSSAFAKAVRFVDGLQNGEAKNKTDRLVRPVRRVPV